MVQDGQLVRVATQTSPIHHLVPLVLALGRPFFFPPPPLPKHIPFSHPTTHTHPPTPPHPTPNSGHHDCLVFHVDCHWWDYCEIDDSKTFDLFNWNYGAGGQAQTSSKNLWSISKGASFANGHGQASGSASLDCVNCYAYIQVGLEFKFEMKSDYKVDELSLTATGSVGASVGLQLTVEGSVSYTSDDITLLDDIPGPEIPIPLGPVTIPLSTSFAVYAKVQASASATATATAAASYDRSVTYGIQLVDGALTSTKSVGGDGFQMTAPALHASGEVGLQAWLMPDLRLYITDWIPLGAHFRLSPYAGFEGQLQDLSIDWDLYAGLDLDILTDPIEFKLGDVKTFHLVDAHDFSFHLIQKTILKSGAWVGEKRGGGERERGKEGKRE